MIYFTAHAKDKFEILKRHGVFIIRRQVLDAVLCPEIVDNSRAPLKIVQRQFDETRVLRVVYREERRTKIIITFYPGRKSQYEKK
ncbi:MAG: DUF4258 domain-containing protein [Candidatus Sungbacteria bacterium]|nr:DUF4258 domain-containing protein [Candidatus Sungbacteria bacterium]